MLLFRSEEEIERWAQEHGMPVGGIVPVRRLALLARDWYGDRLDPDWRPRSHAASQTLLHKHGLDEPFWRLR
jgi:hypothetical protein